MSVTRYWLGGGTNNVMAPNDWSPSGVPQPGDTLVIRSGTANMIGGNLAGDTLILADAPYSQATQTLNMSRGAHIEKLEVAYNNATVNVSGHDTIETLQTDLGYGNYVTFNIQPHSSLKMQITDPPTPEGVHVVGLGRSSLLINDGPSFVQNATLDVDVTGHGSWTPSGFFPNITFDKAVGRGQTINLENAPLTINDPAEFKAVVNLTMPYWGSAFLKGVHGDLFFYYDDVLKILSHGRVVDTLRVHESGGAAFSLANTSSGLAISASFAAQVFHGQIT